MEYNAGGQRQEGLYQYVSFFGAWNGCIDNTYFAKVLGNLLLGRNVKMNKMLRRIWFRMKGLSPSDKISIVSEIIAGLSLIIAVFSFGWTIYTNHGQDSQWKASFKEQQAVVAILQEDNETLKNSLEALTNQNAILEENNKAFKKLLDELSEQTAISKINLETLLSERDIQCRISYLCCWYDSLWSLRNELEKDNVLIVNNNLAKTLGLEYIENAEPYDYPESYLEFKNELDGLTSPIIVFLKIDLTSNSAVLTQDLVLNVSEVNFPQILPIALSKLSMYAESTGSGHQGNIHNVEQYHGEIVEATYTFSDQIISDKQYTTILCPVMVQVAKDETKETSMLTPCTSTYKFVSIPKSISFTDLAKNQTIIKTIRDINDSAAITEYRTVIGYG